MVISIGIPGIQRYIQDIPDGMVILLEGGADHMPSNIAQALAPSAFAQKRPVRYITSRRQEDVILQILNNGQDPEAFNVTENIDPDRWGDHILKGAMVIVDSFSFFILGKEVQYVKDLMLRLRSVCREMGANLVLIAEQGMLERTTEAVTHYLADGIIQFMFSERPEGVSRYLRIPKWVNETMVDQNIFYEYEGGHIKIDLRSRVV